MNLLSNPTQEELFDLWCEDLIEAGFIRKVLKTKDIPPFILLKEKYFFSEHKRIKYAGTKREIEVTDRKKHVIEKGTLYTPDRMIIWEPEAEGIFYRNLEERREKKEGMDCHFYSVTDWGSEVTHVDVKAPPGYGGMNSSDASFSVKSKLVYEKHSIKIAKVYNSPNKVVKNVKPYLWLDTFTPSRYYFTDKTGKPRKISNWKPRTLEAFLAEKFDIQN
tara:strand:+ start:16040 stop:16696 length:657 start_codon:yes stop_codon:yes gene_type:complete